MSNAPQIIVRKSMTEKKESLEKKLVLVCDLRLAIEYLKSELNDCKSRDRKGVILSNLKHTRSHLNGILAQLESGK